jgi:hypothetical protein
LKNKIVYFSILALNRIYVACSENLTLSLMVVDSAGAENLGWHLGIKNWETCQDLPAFLINIGKIHDLSEL